MSMRKKWSGASIGCATVSREYDELLFNLETDERKMKMAQARRVGREIFHLNCTTEQGPLITVNDDEECANCGEPIGDNDAPENEDATSKDD